MDSLFCVVGRYGAGEGDLMGVDLGRRHVCGGVETY